MTALYRRPHMVAGVKVGPSGEDAFYPTVCKTEDEVGKAVDWALAHDMEAQVYDREVDGEWVRR